MKKIPTVLVRDPDHRSRVLDGVTPGCEWVLRGEGRPTRKYNGTCVLIRRDLNAVIGFARRTVKPDKMTPPGFVQIDFDDVTGIAVGWEPIESSGFARWFDEAVTDHGGVFGSLTPGTYELCGPKINGNPEGLTGHRLFSHERAETAPLDLFIVELMTVDILRHAVTAVAPWEGIVWHHPDGRMAKLKRRDLA